MHACRKGQIRMQLQRSDPTVFTTSAGSCGIFDVTWIQELASIDGSTVTSGTIRVTTLQRNDDDDHKRTHGNLYRHVVRHSAWLHIAGLLWPTRRTNQCERDHHEMNHSPLLPGNSLTKRTLSEPTGRERFIAARTDALPTSSTECLWNSC